MQKKMVTKAVGILFALIAAVAGFVATSGDSTPKQSTDSSQSSVSATSASETVQSPQISDQPLSVAEAENQQFQDRKSELPGIVEGSLPPEAIDTLELIENKGPYPYSKDNSTFQNRERLLPLEDQNYYREFTVETPGSRDRGARRVVTGADGEGYYTSDHYESFSEIEGWSWK